MPHTLPTPRPLAALVAFVVAISMVVVVAQRAEADPPVDEIVWTNEACIDGVGSAMLTVTGNGRWATVQLQVTQDGGISWYSPSDLYNPWRIEHGWDVLPSFDDVDQFRARDVRNNGTPIGDWVESDPVDC